MVTWEEILSKAKNAVQLAGEKTGELWDVTKLKMEINRVEQELADTFEGLGRLVYDAKQGETDVEELMDVCVEHIEELNKELTRLQNKIAELKNATRCAGCGLLNDQDAAFCKGCGEKL